VLILAASEQPDNLQLSPGAGQTPKHGVPVEPITSRNPVNLNLFATPTKSCPRHHPLSFDFD